MVSNGKHRSHSWISRIHGPPEGSSKGIVSVWNNLDVSSILLPSLIPRKQKAFEVHLVCIALSWMRSALIHFFSRPEPINWIVYWILNWIFIFLWSSGEFEKEQKFATNYFDTIIFPLTIAVVPEGWPWKPNTIQVNQVHHQKWNVSELICELMFLLTAVFNIFFSWKTDTHYSISSIIPLAEKLFGRFMRHCWEFMHVFKRTEGHHMWMVCK